MRKVIKPEPFIGEERTRRVFLWRSLTLPRCSDGKIERRWLEGCSVIEFFQVVETHKRGNICEWVPIGWAPEPEYYNRAASDRIGGEAIRRRRERHTVALAMALSK